MIERWLTNGTAPDTHALYISAWNQAKSVLQAAQNSLINRIYQNLSSSNRSRDFWHLAKNISNNFSSSSFPSLFIADGTLVPCTSLYKYKLIASSVCFDICLVR